MKYICVRDWVWVRNEAMFIKGKTYTVNYVYQSPLGYSGTHFTEYDMEILDLELSYYFKPKFLYGK